MRYRRRFTGATATAPFTPASLSNLYVWLDANQESYANNDPVGTMTDKSGNGYNATQATSSMKPTFKTSVINSKPAYYFDGGDSCSFASGVANWEYNSAFTVCTVARYDSIIGARAIIGNRSQNYPSANAYRGWYYAFRQSSASNTTTLYSHYGSNLFLLKYITSPTLSANEWFQGTTSYSGSGYFAGMEHRLKAGSTTTTETGTEPLATSMQSNLPTVVGNIADGTAIYLLGYIAELIIYNRELTASEKTQIEKYFTSKYGV